jgi:uncharacterized protein
MILYLDTSALVKIYVEETRSVDVRENAKYAEGLATSRIAYAEARAMFLCFDGRLATAAGKENLRVVK